MSRTNEILRSFPLATLGIIGLCTFLHMLQLLLDFDLHKVTMCPRLVLYLHEYYRIISSTLFHGSLMHVGMNMVSTAAIASVLEKRFGTLRLAVTILWSMLATSIVYIGIALFLWTALGLEGLMYQHAVGFSGVLFHLSILECTLTPGSTRSLFGFVSVPSYLYPPALLVALQVVMPGLSFTGHLAGIFTGTLQVFGLLGPVTVSDVHLRELESAAGLQWLVQQRGFVATPAASSGTTQRDPSNIRHAVQHGCRAVSTYVAHITETIKVILFGRGREANSNIQLPVWESEPIMASDDIEDDDDWVGLPTVSSENSTIESHLV